MSEQADLKNRLLALETKVNKVVAEGSAFKAETQAEIASLKEKLDASADTLDPEVFAIVDRISANVEALDTEFPDLETAGEPTAPVDQATGVEQIHDPAA